MVLFKNTELTYMVSLNDQVIFSDGAKLTTTDALQIQEKYCKAKGNGTFIVIRAKTYIVVLKGFRAHNL